MDVIDSRGRKIDSLSSWERIYDSPRSARQWKEHRSAYSLADFVVNRNGVGVLQARVSDALGETVQFERATPELEIRFDQFGRGRVHDLGIYGRTEAGQTLFVGVEAKVDESFGALVRDTYLAAKARQGGGNSTNVPKRIEQLLKLHFTGMDAGMCDVRYQLLYATMGTLAANADRSVLYIVVFKTRLYSDTIGAENSQDYVDFMRQIGATSLQLSNKKVRGYKVVLGGKELVCLYEHIELDI